MWFNRDVWSSGMPLLWLPDWRRAAPLGGRGFHGPAAGRAARARVETGSSHSAPGPSLRDRDRPASDFLRGAANTSAMSMAGCLAVAQTIPVRGDVTTNLEQHLRLAGVARAAGAGLLIFPELSLTGYELDLAERLAFAPDDERLAPLVDAAASSSMILIAGAPVRLDGRLHIAAFIISLFGVAIVFSIIPALVAFICALVISLLFGYVPARKAAMLNPVAALGAE